MTNPLLLAQELGSYELALERQLAAISEEFLLLQRSWSMLRDCYEGTAADQFDALWHGTSRHFEDCMERAATLRGVLAERIAALKAFDEVSV
jgi:hypothetical protein